MSNEATSEAGQEAATAAFNAAFNAVMNKEAPTFEPAPDADAAPKGPAEGETAEGNAAAEDDELAGLPPKVRAMLDEFQQIKQAVAAVPGLEQRLRKTEGRIGDLNTRLPAPPPPAPPKLEKVERVRAELPEVAEAMEEFVEHHLKALKPSAQVENSSTGDDPALLLDRVAPDWRGTVQKPEFSEWVKAQGGDYHARIDQTTDPAEMLDAVTRFKAHELAKTKYQQDAQAEAQRIAQTRNARTSAAAAPAGAGRRNPTTANTAEQAFSESFRRVAGTRS